MNWETLGQFEDIVYEKRKAAKVTINCPEKRTSSQDGQRNVRSLSRCP